MVKIYLLKGLDGIGKHDKEAIQCEFETDSLDLKIRDFNGKNLRFNMRPLEHHISVGDSKIQVKSNSITITLKKADKKTWD